MRKNSLAVPGSTCNENNFWHVSNPQDFDGITLRRWMSYIFTLHNCFQHEILSWKWNARVCRHSSGDVFILTAISHEFVIKREQRCYIYSDTMYISSCSISFVCYFQACWAGTESSFINILPLVAAIPPLLCIS